MSGTEETTEKPDRVTELAGEVKGLRKQLCLIWTVLIVGSVASLFSTANTLEESKAITRHNESIERLRRTIKEFQGSHQHLGELKNSSLRYFDTQNKLNEEMTRKLNQVGRWVGHPEFKKAPERTSSK